jgi:hypothetical protein
VVLKVLQYRYLSSREPHHIGGIGAGKRFGTVSDTVTGIEHGFIYFLLNTGIENE